MRGGCGTTIVFRLDCATEVRKRSNETWLKIHYGQLRIRIKNMWLRRVYFVLLKFLRAKIAALKREAVSLPSIGWPTPARSVRRENVCSSGTGSHRLTSKTALLTHIGRRGHSTKGRRRVAQRPIATSSRQLRRWPLNLSLMQYDFKAASIFWM